jgi:phytoene synthase
MQPSCEPTPAELAACRALLRGGSRTFHAASFLLPARVRDPAVSLYAFCRVADDAIDAGGGHAALAQLHARLDAAYAGRPLPIPADRAFADVVARHAIPRALPDALLEGLAWDAEGRRYQTIEDLYAYAARVAGTVGVMMALLMGARSPGALARACDLGIAMQLTNIARDIGEDARNGRIYLPLDWLREMQIDPQAWLAAPVFDGRIAAMVERLLRLADVLYLRAADGIAELPLACRPGISAARFVYAEIGRAVARNGHDSVTRRAVVPLWRKLALLGVSLGASMRPARGATSPVLAQAQFLVDAAHGRPALRQVPWWNLRARALFVIDLFERLERRSRAA